MSECLPHVDVERLGLVDLEASGPGAVSVVHEAHTQQLVVVIPGPVEHHTGAGWRRDVALGVSRALQQNTSERKTMCYFNTEYNLSVVYL